MALLRSKASTRPTPPFFSVAIVAVLVAMAVLSSPCHAEKCFLISPCTMTTCKGLCSLEGYGDNPRIVCRPGEPLNWDTCCCSIR